MHGNIDFTGFLGDYQLTAHVNGRKLSAGFTLDKTTKTAVELKLT